MKSRVSRIILSILILSLALQTFTFPALAQSEANESEAEVENLVELPEIEQLVYPDDREAPPYPDDGFEDMPPELAERYQRDSEIEVRPEYIPPSPEIIAETQAQVAAFDCATVTDVSQIECEALVALYESTNGAGWKKKTYWLQSTMVTTWFGITVDSGVISIDLPSNQLTGSIPTELGNLSNLRQLDLFYNQLTGNIPGILGSLSNLEVLDLDGNQLTGSIPSSLGNLSNLQDLRLGNQLTGSIPAELGNLFNLRLLYLHDNQLTGGIPAALGNLSNLEALYLSENQLTGSIPATLGNLSNLDRLWLFSNKLTGSIPAEIGNLSNVRWLHLFDNRLTGSLPAALGNLSNLEELRLYNNQLTGSLPAALGNLSSLELLNLSKNHLTGSIPPELGNLSNLWGLILDNNQLSGDIPSTLGNLSNVGWLYLFDNQLTGSIPLSFVNLSHLNYFYFSETNLCEPTTPEFIAWKNTVINWRGTSNICPASWLLMYYMAGDNDLDRALRLEITNIIMQKNFNVDIAIFLDSALIDSSYRFFNQGGPVEYQDMGNLNSGKGKTLTDFVNWAKSKSTAANQALIIDDHGHGLAGIASDDRANNDKLEVNGEIRTALLDAGKVDLIWTFACLMGNLEFMWSLRDLTDYYIGHESVSYPSTHDYVSSINQSTTPEDLSQMIAESFVRDRENEGTPSSISAIDMAFIQEMFTKSNALAKAIRKSPYPKKTEIYEKLDSSVLQRFDESSPDGIDNSDRLADLFQFANLMLEFDSTKTAAEELLALEDDFIIFNRAWSGRYGDGPFIDHSKARGVSISLPMKPMSFYVGSWMEFGKGADWSFLNGTKSLDLLEEEEGYDWGPMISEMILINNPDGEDDSNPPELIPKLIPDDFFNNLFLPLIFR